MFGRKDQVKQGMVDIYAHKGLMLMDQNRYEEAMSELKKSLEINDRQHDVMCNIGICFVQATVQELLNTNGAYKQDAVQTFDIAQDYFLKAIKLKPNYQLAKDNLSRLRDFRISNGY